MQLGLPDCLLEPVRVYSALALHAEEPFVSRLIAGSIYPAQNTLTLRQHARRPRSSAASKGRTSSGTSTSATEGTGLTNGSAIANLFLGCSEEVKGKAVVFL